jgi:hypothetical protein
MSFRLPSARVLAAATLLAVAAWMAVGCASSKSTDSLEAETSLSPKLSEENQALARGFLSAVEIHGQSLVTVQETIESVFTSAGLALSKRTAEQIAFERPATKRERGAYGTWFGEDVRVRMRVEIMQQTGGVFFLRCRSYIARDAGTTAEDEQVLARRHVRGYEGLLDEVSARLN